MATCAPARPRARATMGPRASEGAGAGARPVACSSRRCVTGPCLCRPSLQVLVRPERDDGQTDSDRAPYPRPFGSPMEPGTPASAALFPPWRPCLSTHCSPPPPPSSAESPSRPRPRARRRPMKCAPARRAGRRRCGTGRRRRGAGRRGRGRARGRPGRSQPGRRRSRGRWRRRGRGGGSSAPRPSCGGG